MSEPEYQIDKAKIMRKANRFAMALVFVVLVIILTIVSLIKFL